MLRVSILYMRMVLCILSLGILALANGCDAPKSQKGSAIHVAAAISLQQPLTEIAASFERETGTLVKLSFASSGQLMGQIRSGAPIDVFISAAQQQVDQLAEDNLIDAAARRVIATNTLALIVPADAPSAPADFAELADSKVRRLAMGEPRTVPAGQYAQQVLDYLKLTDSLRERLIYGTNVRQVLAYVERGEVDAGIVYHTDAMVSGKKVRIVATAEAEWHQPIEYPAAVMAGSRNASAAADFLAFLASPAAREVLEAHGFGSPGYKAATKPSSE